MKVPKGLSTPFARQNLKNCKIPQLNRRKFVKSEAIKGKALASFSMICAGLAAIPYSIVLDAVAPLTIVYAMFIVAFILQVGSILLQKQKILVSPLVFIYLLVMGAFGVAGNYTIGRAILEISPTIAMTIQRSEIIIAMVLSVFKTSNTLPQTTIKWKDSWDLLSQTLCGG